MTLATCAMGLVCCAAAALAQLWPWPPVLFLALAVLLLSALVTMAPKRLPAWTSWAGCASILFFFLFITQRALLSDYHDRFGLRRQVEISAAYEQEEELPILTYPKRWDSISFYARRGNVESYAPLERARLMRDLEMHGKALVFVRRDGALDELLKTLPAELEIEFLGRPADYVAVGLVRRRPK